MGSLSEGIQACIYGQYYVVSEVTTENSERLGRQVQPGIESNTSRLTALNVEPPSHWWVRKILGE